MFGYVNVVCIRTSTQYTHTHTHTYTHCVSHNCTYKPAHKSFYFSASSSVDSVQSSVGSSKDGTKDSLGIPLAEAARPSKIHEYVGQHSVLGKDSMLYTVLESGDLPSLIFWGPPGCGKVGLGTGDNCMSKEG